MKLLAWFVPSEYKLRLTDLEVVSDRFEVVGYFCPNCGYTLPEKSVYLEKTDCTESCPKCECTFFIKGPNREISIELSGMNNVI